MQWSQTWLDSVCYWVYVVRVYDYIVQTEEMPLMANVCTSVRELQDFIPPRLSSSHQAVCMCLYCYLTVLHTRGDWWEMLVYQWGFCEMGTSIGYITAHDITRWQVSRPNAFLVVLLTPSVTWGTLPATWGTLPATCWDTSGSMLRRKCLKMPEDS